MPFSHSYISGRSSAPPTVRFDEGCAVDAVVVVVVVVVWGDTTAEGSASSFPTADPIWKHGTSFVRLYLQEEEKKRMHLINTHVFHWYEKTCNNTVDQVLSFV